MVGDKKTKVKRTNKTSEVLKKTKISDEELLSQILDKKNKRKNSVKAKKENSNQTVDNKNDLELSKNKKESIQSKKNKPSTSSKNTTKKSLNSTDKTTNTIKKTKSTTTKSKKVQDKPSKAQVSDEELLSSIINKKQNRKKKNDNLPIDDKKELTKKLDTSNKDKSDHLEEVPTESNNGENVEKTSKKKKNDLIITRKITFDENYVNLKDKKTLKKLKEAIEEFDRIETLSEIAQSSDKINAVSDSEDTSSSPNNSEEKEKNSSKLIESVKEKGNHLFSRAKKDKKELSKEKSSSKKSTDIKNDDIKTSKEDEDFSTKNYHVTQQNQHNEEKENEQTSSEQLNLEKDLDKKSSSNSEKLSLEKYLEQARASKNKKDEENKENEQNQKLIEDLLEDSDEEADYLKNYKYDKNSISPEPIPNYQDKSEIRKKFLCRSCIILFTILICIFIISLILNNHQEKKQNTHEDSVKSITEPSHNNDEELAKLYQDCLNKSIDKDDYTTELTDAINELNNYISTTYKASIKYEDLNTGFTYTYNEEEIYYAASTIKVLDALYLYQKAAANEIDLNETMKYTSKYKYKSSAGMSRHHYGEEISLRKLIEYAIVYSDNAAHQMLVDYIGRSTLKEFGQKLGAQRTLVGGDNFGNLDVNDAIIYMKAVNDFINNNPNLGKELQNIMIKADQNDLELPQHNILAAHKYGNYGAYYHDYGIVYHTSPYVVAILTTEGKGDYEAKVKDINNHIFQLHQTFIHNREQLCQTQIYK